MLERCFRELVRYYRYSAAGRRVGGIAHLMNTPLQVLSFELDLLEQKSQEEARYLQECRPEVADRLQSLRDYCNDKICQVRSEVDHLRVLSQRLTFQGMQEDVEGPRCLDLNQICRQELELYQAESFFKHRVEKKIHFQEGLPYLLGNYLDFSQTLRNLVDNALEAMAEAALRILTVETAAHEGWLILRVGDTGAGIPREILPRIFDPFFSTKGTPEAPRVGLGLFMARRLLAPVNGAILTESQPGKTWFTVRLPVKAVRL